VQDGGAHDADADHDHIGHDVILPRKGPARRTAQPPAHEPCNSPRRAQARELAPRAIRNENDGLHMCGFVTERDLELADLYFPGIALSFRQCSCPPRTFLDLLNLFLAVPRAQARRCWVGQGAASTMRPCANAGSP